MKIEKEIIRIKINMIILSIIFGTMILSLQYEIKEIIQLIGSLAGTK